MKSINPYTLKVIEEFTKDTPEEVSRKLKQAQSAFEDFRGLSFNDRMAMMQRLAQLLMQYKQKYGRLMSEEMGKPIKEAVAEVEKCAWVCEFYAENAEEFLKKEEVKTDADSSYISYEPLGVVLAVMPWNFPFWQVFRFAAPTLMAGNTAILKHAPNVQRCARQIEELFSQAGFPVGVFQNMIIDSSRVEDVIRDPIIKAVSLTGSVRAGSAVAQIAGREIKPSVLELGGSCGFIVLADADLEKAALLAAKARMINNAQSCIAAKRFIVEESVEEEFVARFKAALAELKPGDPLDENTQVGPLARVDLAEELERQLKESVEKGAELVMGGKRQDAYFEPTLIRKVKPGMPAFDEELFGPVAAIISAKNAEEAIALNNQSSFGLGASIITENYQLAEKLAPQIEDGAVFINEMIKSDPRIPFGGTKKSGYGRELGRLGIHEFVNAKTVHVKREMGG